MRRLVSAATEEFTRAGFRGATTAAIAARAEVTEAQLFRYFDSKAELFRAAVFEPLNTGFARFNARQLTGSPEAGDLHEPAGRYIAELEAFIREHAPRLLSLMVAEAYDADSLKSVSDMDALGEYFQRGAEVMSRRAGNDPQVDPALMVRVSFAAVLANVLFRDWLFPDGMASEEEISAALADFVVDGISANDTPGADRQNQRSKT